MLILMIFIAFSWSLFFLYVYSHQYFKRSKFGEVETTKVLRVEKVIIAYLNSFRFRFQTVNTFKVCYAKSWSKPLACRHFKYATVLVAARVKNRNILKEAKNKISKCQNLV